MSRETFGMQAATLYHNLHYNNRLQLVDIRLGDSVSDEWNWSRGALVSYYGTAARDAWNPFANSTDNNGNVLRQLHYVPLSGGGYVLPQLDDYTYDEVNRIKSVTEAQLNSSGGWTFNLFTQNFNYDRWGNRTVSCSPCQPGVTGDVFTIDTATNRITAKNGNGMTYDAAGNQTYDATGNRWFDGENRMNKAVQGGTTSHYVYDADGKRVRRIIGSTETWMIYGVDGELVGEYAAAASATSPQKEYGYRSGQMLIVAQTSPLEIRWTVTDHLGSPRMNIRGTGTDGGSLASVTRHDYLPFGEDLIAGIRLNGSTGQHGYEPPPDGVRQKFTGKERDTETGLDYFGARYFSSIQGRFTSPDEPLYDQYEDEPQSWNLYSYVRNNPLVNIDPNGKETCYYLDGKQVGCDNAKDFNIKDGTLTVNGKSFDLAKLDAQEIVRSCGCAVGHEQQIPYAFPDPFNWGDRTGAKGVVVLAGTIAARPPYTPQKMIIPSALLLSAGLLYLTNHNNLPPPVVINPNIEARKPDLELVDYMADKYKIPRDVLSDRIHWEKQKSGRGGKDNLGKKKIEELAKEIADELNGGDPQN